MSGVLRYLFRYRRKCRLVLVTVFALGFLAYLLISGNENWQRVNFNQGDIIRTRHGRYLRYQANEINRTGPGEQGESVKYDDKDLEVARKLAQQEGFNFLASENLVALDRSLKDVRPFECRTVQYPADLPTASVIIVYHNEARSVILRTAHSVINRSPPHLLHEVLLVDDASTRPELGAPLNEYIQSTWPDQIVRVIRTPERSGLIRAKVFGAKAASGDVLVFLDAHCEATKGWLEPMLNRIRAKRSAVLCPMIDLIGTFDLGYSRVGGPHSIGGFSWGLHFTWWATPRSHLERRNSSIDPLRSPTMAGGLFAVNRDYFFEIGAYDTGMEIWGGENLELSFRVWMCGGSLEFIPCSHVGHIFRSTHPYGFPDKKRDYHGLNSKRLAEVWLDQYKDIFYAFRPDLADADAGDISERVSLRQRMQCKDFRWYLANVYPDKFVMSENVQGWGQLRNPTTDLCLDTLAANEKSSYALGVYLCQPTSSNEVFALSLEGTLRREDRCASYSSREPGHRALMRDCDQHNNTANRWLYHKGTRWLQHEQTGYCLDVDGVRSGQYPVLAACNGRPSQQWKWKEHRPRPAP